jgi:hypothetical protein
MKFGVPLLKFRILLQYCKCIFSMPLPIETGRWANILKQHRKCHLCNLEIGNKFHYLFICSYPQTNAEYTGLTTFVLE